MGGPNSPDLSPLEYQVLEFYRKLQLKPITAPEFKDALCLIWSALLM